MTDGRSKRRAEMILALERRLLDPAVRSSANKVSELLAEDFVEFGASGNVYDKAEIVRSLPLETMSHPEYAILADQFNVSFLSLEVALVTYRTERRHLDRVIAQSRRSSIWKTIDGRWLIVFHQGTPIPSDS